MKHILLSVLFCLLTVFPFHTEVTASDIIISGSAQFASSFRAAYMKKHDYFFIEEIRDKNNNKVNLFAARDADVIIKNEDNMVVGITKTDEKGFFSLSVPEYETYHILVQFHDRSVEGTVNNLNTTGFFADLGYFDTEIVGSWLYNPALSYCYTCNIRTFDIYNTSKKAM